MVQAGWLSFYRAYSNLLRFLLSAVPFSVGDLYYLLIAGFFLIETWLIIKLVFSRHEKLKSRMISKKIFSILLVLFLIYLQFLVSWGLNYRYRSYISESKLLILPPKTEAVDSLCQYLVKSCIHDKLVMANNPETAQCNALAIFNHAKFRYLDVSQKHGYFTDTYQKKHMPGLILQYPARISLKPSLYSSLMNYMGVSGYFNPFTGEAQVNQQIPSVELPFTSCHEIAHELGYGFEYEANFIGYLVSTSDNDKFFNYSGHLEALMYALPELRSRDSLAFKKIIKTLSPAIITDIRNDLFYWRKYRGSTEKLISFFYTGYLKANKQPQGMQSYSDLVPLLCAYYKKYGYNSVTGVH